MTATVIIGIIALISLSSLLCLVTVTSSRTLQKAFRVLDSQQVRHSKQIEDLLNRLMTINWEDYVATRSTFEEGEGAFLAPEDQSEEETVVMVEAPPLWGSVRRGSSNSDEAEHELLAEDFPEDR